MNQTPFQQRKLSKKKKKNQTLVCDKIWPLHFKIANQNKLPKENYLEKILNGSFSHFLGK